MYNFGGHSNTNSYTDIITLSTTNPTSVTSKMDNCIRAKWVVNLSPPY